MPKTLVQAIGCWTTNQNYNSLPIHAKRIKQATERCKLLTESGIAGSLLVELELLKRQLRSMSQCTDTAIDRCREILSSRELEKDD